MCWYPDVKYFDTYQLYYAFIWLEVYLTIIVQEGKFFMRFTSVYISVLNVKFVYFNLYYIC